MGGPDFGIGFNILFCSVYLQDGEGLSETNRAIIAFILQLVLASRLPFVVAALGLPVCCPPLPRRPPAQRNWSWEAGTLLEKLAPAYREWMAAMERELCSLHGLSGKEARKHTGRAAGMQTMMVSLQHAVKTTASRTYSECTLRWLALGAWAGKVVALAEKSFEKGAPQQGKP